jgi:glycosyltransferase involved in cell wall biosynthesis
MASRVESKRCIAIDASRSIDGVQKTGVEVVSDALLRHFASRHEPTTLFYTPQEIPWLPKDAQDIIVRHRFWTIIGLSLAMLRDKPDVLFVPVHTLPFFCPKKTVRVIHDVSFLRHPEAYSLRERTYMKFDVWRAKRICTSIIVPTEAVKRDLVELLDWDEKKIVVTGWGVPQNSLGLVPGVTEVPFILFIGRIETKKNVANIIRAFGLFKQTHPEWELVLAGKPGHGFEAIEPFLKSPGVRYLGYISDEKKAELLGTASMLAFISYEEGFAFPVLEAFQAHVPVLASLIPTLTEIAQDAALFSLPDDIEHIAKNMSSVADDGHIRALLIAKGRERVQAYSWEEVVKKIQFTFM